MAGLSPNSQPGLLSRSLSVSATTGLTQTQSVTQTYTYCQQPPTKFMQQNCQLCCFHSSPSLTHSPALFLSLCVCLSASWPLSHMSEQAAGSRQVNRSLTHQLYTVAALHIYVTLPEWPEASHSCEWHKYASKSLKGAGVRDAVPQWKLVKIIQHGAFL